MTPSPLTRRRVVTPVACLFSMLLSGSPTEPASGIDDASPGTGSTIRARFDRSPDIGPAAHAADRQNPDDPALLAPLFQDHAVLQRDRPIPVWGRASPGEIVEITLGAQTARATADASGRWRAELPPMPAGGPHRLTATSSSGRVATADDILIGEVWLCSGQSNMELPVARTLNAEDEIRRAANDTIRLLTIGHADSPVPLDEIPTPVSWQRALPETVRTFSAACYYFARELQKTVPVPMGLIHSSWGGSNIEAWISAGGLRAAGSFDERLGLLDLYARDRPAAVARLGEMWERWWRSRVPGPPGVEPWRSPSGDGWTPAPAGLGSWRTWGVPALAEFNGMVWFRRVVRLTAAQAAQSATLALGRVDEVDQIWVNGRAVGSSFGWGTPRSYDLPPGVLQAGDNLLVVNVLSTWGDGGLLGPPEAMALRFDDGTAIPLGEGWTYRIVPPEIGFPPRAPWHAIGGLTMLYNAMVAPIAPYALRGVAWYQGESNTGDPDAYEALLSALMADWRRTFGTELPFLVVQLPNFGPAPTKPVDTGWARLREAQRRAVARDRRAALVVTVDIGDRYELHPPNKQEVGRRLARAARWLVYGEAISPSGPAARAAVREDGHVVVTFDGVEGRLVAYSAAEPIGFELCGADQASCRFARAVLDGRRVIIADEFRAATRVRYCWGDGPICTLSDESGLPAGPFELPITERRRLRGRSSHPTIRR
ncbi:MAG TPA: sialate O-acetylesterase [Vicinamibacterales bacterium]|nr:sialate O-acetylesterase [Vicinamibacterales bacterium]